MTKHGSIDLTQLFNVIYRAESVVEASKTQLAKSKGLLR